MGDRSRIEWTDATWNPVTGCSKVSPGCANCYAERLALRFGWSEKPWTAANAAENVRLHPDRLDLPLRWRRPRRVFVNSMSDLFHEQVPDAFIDRVFSVMALCPQHTFQILTKRPERMRAYLTRPIEQWNDPILAWRLHPGSWPLPNVWLGVSVENQRAADERIPHLLATPAALRFLSCEPLLGPVTLPPEALGGYPESDWWAQHGSSQPRIDWVIVGGESGPNARPMHPDWARSLRDQCVEAGIPFFFKQQGEWSWDTTRPDQAPGFVAPDGTWKPYETLGYGREHPGSVPIWRVGKKAAGRLLDGRTWDEMPEPQEVRA